LKVTDRVDQVVWEDTDSTLTSTGMLNLKKVEKANKSHAQLFNAILALEPLPSVNLLLTMLEMLSQGSAFR